MDNQPIEFDCLKVPGYNFLKYLLIIQNGYLKEKKFQKNGKSC